MKNHRVFFNDSVRRYTIFMAFFFLVSILLGYQGAATDSQSALEVFEEVAESFSYFETTGPVTLFLLIFFNNSLKTLAFTLLGVFFGLAPLLFVFINGFIFGVMAYLIAQQASIWAFIIPVFPHGIIELPTFIIASAYGLWLGRVLGKKVLSAVRTKKNDVIQVPLKTAFLTVLNHYIYIILPLFFVAAAIEATVSMYVINLFFVG